MTRTALIVLAGVTTLLGGEAHRRTEKGNELYEEGALDRALEEYGRAQALVPAAPELPYDLGNVLYRKENWAGAAAAYEKALGSAGPELGPRAAYNLGNALFKDEKYDEAIKAYVRALKTQPRDADAKRNLELALRALEQQKQNPKPNPKNPEGEPKDDEPKQPPRPDDQNKPQPDADKKPPEGGMSPQEAQKLLERVGEQEKANLKREKERRGQAGSVRGKDW